MALFHITIEKVFVRNNDEEVIKLLKEIKDKLKKCDDDEKIRQEIMDKLNAAIADIKSTIP